MGTRVGSVVILLGILGAVAPPAGAAEGLWTPAGLPRPAIAERYGVTLPDAWLERVGRAVLRVEGACTAVFVSGDGLILTNHHCADGCIEESSSAATDYLRDGFLARTPDEERRCTRFAARRLVSIEDVTGRVRAAAEGLDGPERRKALDAAQKAIAHECMQRGSALTLCEVASHFAGVRYELHRYERLEEIRLVWAPESGIAFFGGDPDNFEFPRFDLDAALLRAYAGGKPLRTGDFLPLEPAGAADGEPVLTAGYPAHTDRYLTLAQLEGHRQVMLPSDLLWLAELRGVLVQFSRSSAEHARTAAPALESIENSLKSQRGQLLALSEPTFLAAQRAQETALRSFVAADPQRQARYGAAWEALERSERARRELYGPWQLLEKRNLRSQFLFWGRHLLRGAAERSKPQAERLPDYTSAGLPNTERRLLSPVPVYPELERVLVAYFLHKLREELGPDDPLVRQVLAGREPLEWASRAVETTCLAALECRRALWRADAAAIERSAEPFVVLARALEARAAALRQRYAEEVLAVAEPAAALLAQALHAWRGEGLYPDADSSLRFSYGAVRGLHEQGRRVAPFTTLAGAFERHTGQAPFALPASWLRARAALPADRPFNFVADTDIVGGNSGSPVLNARGEVVGLVFDTNIHGTSGPYVYDGERNRTVAVHAGAIVTALESVYGAPALAAELLGASRSARSSR